MRNYFKLDGVDSRDFGVYISGKGTFNASARDYNMIPVPGRNGDLVGPEKRFQNGTLVYPAFIYANFKQNIADFRNYLLSLVGYHDLIDSYHPTEIRKVLFKGPFEADVEPKNDAGRFDIEFNCKPQRYLASGNEVTTFDSAGETETFSGSIVTFDNPDVATVNALSTAINPIQDLHGYDSPWPAGGGKNIVNIADSTTPITSQTTIASDLSLPAGTYIMSADLNNTGAGSFVMNFHASSGGTSAGLPGVTSADGWVRRVSSPFTLSEETDGHIYCSGSVAGYSGSYKDIMICKSTETDPSVFAPYENLCPISGWDSVEVEAAGVNLWDEQWESGDYRDADGQPRSASTRIRTKNPIHCKPSTTYYFSLGEKRGQLFYYDRDDNFISTTPWIYGGQTFTTPSNCHLIRFYLVATTEYTEGVGINYPATDHTYHPYAGNRYTIQLGQTVYGGTLDVTAGTLTVTHANIASYNGESINEPWISSMDAYVAGTTPTTGAQVVYELATPIVIDLDPVAISAIVGQTNNVWANTGDITATIAFPQYQFTITNPTLFDSQPLLRVYGTGILGIGSQQITITQADVYTDIDCEMMDCFKGTANKNMYVQFTDHNFPVLKPGTNNFSLGTGITKVEITPRWWRV